MKFAQGLALLFCVLIAEAHLCRAEDAPRLSRYRGGYWGGYQAAEPGAWPAVVSLQINGRHYCGGTLVSQSWVLDCRLLRFPKR